LEALISKAAGSNLTPFKATCQSPYNLHSFILNLKLPSEEILRMAGDVLVHAIETGSVTTVLKYSTANTAITRYVNKVNKIRTLETAKVLQGIGLLPGILSQSGPRILTHEILSLRGGSDSDLISYLLAHPNMDITRVYDPAEGCATLFPPFTPLDAAAKKGHLQLITTLLQRGSPVSLSTFRFATYSKSGRRCQELLRLLQSFASSNPTKWIMHSQFEFYEDFETSQLAWRAAVRFNDAFQTLRDIFNWDSKQLGKVLTAAICCGRFHLVSPLLDAGASVNEVYKRYHVESNFGGVENGRFETLHPLVELIETDKIGHQEVFKLVKQLIERGANANQGEGSSTTALQVAARSGNLAVVEYLLKEGADANIVPTADDDLTSTATALQHAAIRGDLAIAFCLLEAGADVNAVGDGEDGRTALECAAEHGRLEMVHLLLQWSSRIDGDYGQSYVNAISLAVRHGHKAVANMVKLYGDGISSHTSASEAPNTDGRYGETIGEFMTFHSDSAGGYIFSFGDDFEDGWLLEDISEESESGAESITHADNPETQTSLVGPSWETNDTATKEVGQSNEAQGNPENWEDGLVYEPENWGEEGDLSTFSFHCTGQEVSDQCSKQLFELGLFSSFQHQETTGYVEQLMVEETLPKSNVESSAGLFSEDLMGIDDLDSWFS
jgi:ankyrin repeat protein